MTSRNKKIAAIIQARCGSKRLPSKVLENLAGQPMLVRVINRTRRAKNLTDVIVATTTQPVDDVIAQLCQKRGWSYFRGSEEDVLDRYYQASLAFDVDVIVRITADCPLIDPEIIDRVLNEFLSRYPEVQYVSTTLIRTYPRGLDVEVVSFQALDKAWREDKNPAWREHVTPFIWRHPEKFNLRNVAHNRDYSHMRWTVDTVEDMAFVRQIYDYFKNDAFGWRDVLKLLKKHPEWNDINRNVQQRAVL